MIHTFGDSHSCFGWIEPMGGNHVVHHNTTKTVGGITVHHLGPVLAYSVGRDGTRLLNITGCGVNANDSVVFSFGEIDCRCHIHKHVGDKKPADIISDIVSGYVNTVLMNIEMINLPVRSYLYNVIPPPRDNTVINSPNFPFLGSGEERLGYVDMFNDNLKLASESHQLGFIDVREMYTTDDGYLDASLSDGSVHIHSSDLLRAYLETNNIK